MLARPGVVARSTFASRVDPADADGAECAEGYVDPAGSDEAPPGVNVSRGILPKN
jgi:hypothetical protein